jgi:Cu2+-exporting ATPase
LPKVLELKIWNWVQLILTLPVVFAAGCFYSGMEESIVTWNLNMFTLIGIGTGVAFYSVW